MKSETYKSIGDPIHGSISLTKLESDILQLPATNRLHHVKQMSIAYYVFPGAQISRFFHSVGALYVGGLIAEKLVGHLSERDFEQLFPKWKRDEVIESVRIACLLHDVGHGPFSHDSEELMRRCLAEKHKQEFEGAMNLFDCKSGDELPIHEYNSYMLITKSEIGKTIEQAGLSAEAIAALLTQHGLSKSWTPEGFEIVRKIVSSQLDADRMDYLLRDGYATGVPYGAVDIDRLISNLLIFKNPNGLHLLAIHERAQNAIENILNARFVMHKWVYTHHMVVASQALMKRAIERIIENRQYDIGQLYWKNFAEGYGDDSEVWQAFVRAFRSDSKEMLGFKGLIDRRFLPNSILKRPLDYVMLVKDVEKKSKVGAEKIAKEKISRFFNDTKLQDEFKNALESEKHLRETVLLAIHKPRSPYSPLSSDDRVMIYYQRSNSLRELTEVSSYFGSINDEWTNFPGVYFAYLIPGVPRLKAADYLRSVREALVSFMASSA